jgi:hypothetical protein
MTKLDQKKLDELLSQINSTLNETQERLDLMEERQLQHIMLCPVCNPEGALNGGTLKN